MSHGILLRGAPQFPSGAQIVLQSVITTFCLSLKEIDLYVRLYSSSHLRVLRLGSAVSNHIDITFHPCFTSNGSSELTGVALFKAVAALSHVTLSKFQPLEAVSFVNQPTHKLRAASHMKAVCFPCHGLPKLLS